MIYSTARRQALTIDDCGLVPVVGPILGPGPAGPKFNLELEAPAILRPEAWHVLAQVEPPRLEELRR